MRTARIVWERSAYRLVGLERNLLEGESPDSLGSIGDGLYLERRTKNALGETIWAVTYEGQDFRNVLPLLLAERETARGELAEARAKIEELLAPEPADEAHSLADLHGAGASTGDAAAAFAAAFR